MAKKEVADALSAIAANNRDLRLLPAEIVKAATSKDHVLHDYFEWDNKKAGHAYRIEQANALVRSVKLTVEIDMGAARVVRHKAPAWVHDPRLPPSESGYIGTGEIKHDTEVARMALDAEIARVLPILERAEGLAMLFDMQEDIAALREKAGRVLARVREASADAGAPH